jgi:hypothetical protein
MNPRYDFSGQVALVTGAAKGMGLATARLQLGAVGRSRLRRRRVLPAVVPTPDVIMAVPSYLGYSSPHLLHQDACGKRVIGDVIVRAAMGTLVFTCLKRS